MHFLLFFHRVEWQKYLSTVWKEIAGKKNCGNILKSKIVSSIILACFDKYFKSHMYVGIISNSNQRGTPLMKYFTYSRLNCYVFKEIYFLSPAWLFTVLVMVSESCTWLCEHCHNNVYSKGCMVTLYKCKVLMTYFIQSFVHDLISVTRKHFFQYFLLILKQMLQNW